jgi:hypothetical protein
MNEELKFNDEIVQLVEEVGTILKSRTQSIKVLVIEKDGEKYVSVQKWWRKSADEPWMEGKGFHFNVKEAGDLNGFLEKASALA